MFYIAESAKSFEQAGKDLEIAVVNHGFGVLHVHNLARTLRSKGIRFGEECKVFEVCNPKQAAKVLAADMKLNMALPCRISVYTEGGETRIGMIRPEPMLVSLSTDARLRTVAQEVETTIRQIIDEAT